MKDIKKYIIKYPDKTLKEIGKEFWYSAFVISKILRKSGFTFTYKKRFLYEERKEKERKELLNKLNAIPSQPLLSK